MIYESISSRVGTPHGNPLLLNSQDVSILLYEGLPVLAEDRKPGVNLFIEFSLRASQYSGHVIIYIGRVLVGRRLIIWSHGE